MGVGQLTNQIFNVMNETIDIIYQRRAVRKYKDLPLAKETIEKLIEAGKMAPSAMNKQAWKFYVLTDKEMIKSFSKEIIHIAAKGIKEMPLKDVAKATLSFFHFSVIKDILLNHDHVFYDAPVVILITEPKDNEWGDLDAGMCAQNIMLSAKAIGLDTCPVGFGKFIMQTSNYSQLGIPAADEVKLAIVVGYGNEEPEAGERTNDNIVFINSVESNTSF